MIIKLHLPDDQLNRLLEISGNAGIGLDGLLSRFIEDLTSDEGPGSLEEWVNLLQNPEEDTEEHVTFSDKQIELMSLMDQILYND